MSIKKKQEVLILAEERRLRRVLVVTALALETRAVRAHIDHWCSSLGRAGTIYECGQFSAAGEEWFVAIAESGAGTHPAQDVVTNAHIDFRGFELVMFVGVAGSRKKDAPIGSVVASSVVYYAHSGKWDPDLGFARRPRTFPVTKRLVSVANWVERERKWFSRVKPPHNDKLPDQTQYPQPFPPAALIAPVISVEAVLADPDSHIEKQIALHDNDAVAVEMEGYGAAYAAYGEETPFIVVRGISDRCGQAKTPEADAINQPVAAAHAAALAFELLDGWGQFYPSASPPSAQYAVGDDSEKPACPETLPPSATTSDAKLQNVLVFNFPGVPSDYPPQKIEQILAKLKEASGTDDIELVRTEEGSFRMFIRTSLPEQKLACSDIFQALSQEVGVRLLGVQDEEDFRRAVSTDDALKQASADMLTWPQNLPNGTHMPRPELGQLLSTIERTDSSTTALLGAPGSGKSALLAALGAELLKLKIPFLAIKADLLPDSVQSEDSLSDSLNLPDRVSAILTRASQTRPVALLVDQLDALAGYLDLRTDRLNVLLNLIRKLGERRNIHIIVSSRTFEYEHDTRLKSVRAEKMTLALPPWSAVLQILESRGVPAADWPGDAQELMRTPQALSTFLKLNNGIQEHPFRKYQAMLDQLWNEQLLSKPSGSRLATLAGKIAEAMAARETLWLASAKFEEQADDVKALIASGILTDIDGTWSRIGFSHQTVFEHALARSFAKGHNRLSTFILERQSSLFVRPKLWATLTYLREIEPATYHEELRTIWQNDDLRLHLRYMLIEFMGQQAAPTNTESSLFQEALSSLSRPVALRAMAGSPGWLELFRASEVAIAMKSQAEANLALFILEKAWSFAPKTVLALIKDFWLSDAAMDRLTWSLFQDCPKWSDALTGIAKTIIGRTEINAFAFDRLISAVGADAPEAALDLAKSRLVAQIVKAAELAQERAKSEPGEGEEASTIWYMSNSPSEPLTNVLGNRDGWDSLEAVAKSHPRLFLEYLWPPFLTALKELAIIGSDHERPGFPIMYKVDLRLDGDHSLGLTEAPLLGAITIAVETLAAEDRAGFLTWLSDHRDDKFSPAQRLLAHGLATNPEAYATRALQFLLDDNDRFHLGDIQDRSVTTKRLVRAVSPFWSNDQIAAFAKAVDSYSPAAPPDLDAKGRQVFYNGIRKTKLGLLLALPEERIKADVAKYIAEESRRFPDSRIGATFRGAEWIGSPIPAKNLALASDEDILNAFRKIPDASNWDNPKDWFKGGNIQLSRAFAEFAKAQPERAVRIMMIFDAEIGSRASGYALDALAETADADLLFKIFDELDRKGFKSEEFRDGVARAVQRLLRREVSIDDRTLEILIGWLSTAAPQESREEEPDENALSTDDNLASKKEKEEETDGALWSHGRISILPNGNYPILEAITRIFLDRQQPETLIAQYAEHLKRREGRHVWEALTKYFRYIRPGNTAMFSDFLRALFLQYPELEYTRQVAVALAYLHREHEGLTHEIIDRWKASDRAPIRQTYGELVTLIAATRPELDWPSELLTEILANPGMTKERVGAAFTAIHLWSEKKFRMAASNILKMIVPVADKAAWAAVFDLFRLVDEITPEPAWISLLEVIAEHIASARGTSSSFIVEKLQTLLPHRASLVARLAHGLIENWSAELADMRTGTPLHAAELVDLAITLHRLGAETRETGTTLFERLLNLNAYMARETLEEIDNRFRTTAARPRPRLPRRKPRTTQRGG